MFRTPEWMLVVSSRNDVECPVYGNAPLRMNKDVNRALQS